MKRLTVWIVFLSLPATVPMALTGCQPVKPVAPTTVVTSGCKAFGKIIVPEADAAVISVPLLTAIRKHNLAYKATCETTTKK